MTGCLPLLGQLWLQPEGKPEKRNMMSHSLFQNQWFSFFFLSALLRDCSLCWDSWNSTMTPTLDAALLCMVHREPVLIILLSCTHQFSYFYCIPFLCVCYNHVLCICNTISSINHGLLQAERVSQYPWLRLVKYANLLVGQHSLLVAHWLLYPGDCCSNPSG